MLLNRIKTLLGVTDNDELIYELTELTVDKHYTVHLADVTKAIKITGASLLNGRKK